jgi:hypothetical protein
MEGIEETRAVKRLKCRLCGFVCERWEIRAHWAFRHMEEPTRIYGVAELLAQFEAVR